MPALKEALEGHIDFLVEFSDAIEEQIALFDQLEALGHYISLDAVAA